MADGQGTADFDRGHKVGKYEILTRLSMGGMAELFLAFTAGPGGFRKFVALKQILPDIKKDESFVKMFLDEARITAALSHANIGSTYDLGIEGGELYLAMEFISGQNLEQVAKAARKKDVPIPLGYTARAMRDSALALHYAHSFVDPSGKPSPVIHRDVSPKNVMVTYQGAVKVIDFGIAKAKGRLNRTQVGMVKGTSGYMSPEQVRNQPLDGRSDLFSLGVMIHEFLTGQRLFAAASDAQMMMAIVEGEIADPAALNPEVPRALADVALKALARAKEARFANGRELAKAIEAAAGDILFEDEQCAEFMQQLFSEKWEKTRQLLELASRPVAADDATALSEFAADISADAGDKTPPNGNKPAPRPAKSPPARSAPLSKTPAPRPSPSPAKTTTPKPRAAPPGDRFKSTLAQELAEAESTASTKRPAPQNDDVGDATDPRATAVRPKLPPRGADAAASTAAAAKKSGGGAFKWLLVLLVVGAIGYSPFAPPPVGDEARALMGGVFSRAKGALDKEMSGEPPPPDEMKLEMTPELNALELQMKQQREIDAQEKARMQKEAELAALQLEQMAKVDAGSPVAEITPTKDPKKLAAGKSKTPAKTDVKVATAKKGGDKTLDPDQVEVLDTSSSSKAEQDGVGWLTLYTVPPAAVFDGDANLGTTPLTKVPFPTGVYKLKVMDPDGSERLLSVPIKPGQVTQMKLRVSDLPVAK